MHADGSYRLGIRIEDSAAERQIVPLCKKKEKECGEKSHTNFSRRWIPP